MSLEALKWWAVGLMVLDHVALAFFPDLLLLRAPGRLVWPVFASLMAAQLARGYPPERYARRLLPFALLAQPVYALAFGFPPVWPLNILFTLLSVALLRKDWGPLAALLSLASESPLGLLLVELLARGKVRLAALLHGAVMGLTGWPPGYALLGGGAVLLAWGAVQKAAPGRRSPWWVFYAFYPAHLGALALAKWVLEGR